MRDEPEEDGIDSALSPDSCIVAWTGPGPQGCMPRRTDGLRPARRRGTMVEGPVWSGRRPSPSIPDRSDPIHRRVSSMPRTVLIVDDERDTNDMLADLVHARGFEPVQVFQGALVVEAVRRHEPDIILLDLMMPDLDGFKVCELLKRNRETNLIPVLMVTALNDAGHRAQGVRVGANGYVAKPFTPDALFAAIDAALAWGREHADHGTRGEINFDIRSEATYLQEVNDLLTDLYAHTPLTERQVKDLRQAVMEMGGNAIEWGHRKNADLPLRITYRINPDSVTLVIKDQGPGFDPTTLSHAASEEDPIGHLDIRNELGLREGGFGIMLARGLVDEFRYNDLGNEVTLVKRFVHQAPRTGEDGAL
jgi:DNA-binding response OmpR family regulator